MRLFFALWPDEQVRARLARCARELRTSCGGRPVPAQRLHMTLAFLGDADDKKIEEVERAAGEVAPRALSLVLDQPGYWKHNRIVWAGASAVPAGLAELVLELRGALARSRIAFDPKPFAAHVTLLRDARKPRAMPSLEPIAWDAKGFALLRSQPQPAGGDYEILNAWKPAA